MNRNLSRIVSGAALTVALLAPLGAWGQTPLTPDLTAKLMTLAATKGHGGKVAPRFANSLGLTATGQIWTGREAEADNSAGHHFVDVGPGPNGEILLTLLTPNAVTAYRVRRDGTLLSALSADVATRAITMLSPADAQPSFAAECAFWAQHIDSFLAQK
ncbi:MAG TPA: hypothetical protein VGL73_05240 [Caulobacteraceae bacterium]|jgi:hypothetical protein